MFTYTLIRDNETIYISEYGFEIFIDGVHKRSGCVENLDETIAALIEAGYTLID